MRPSAESVTGWWRSKVLASASSMRLLDDAKLYEKRRCYLQGSTKRRVFAGGMSDAASF